MPGSRLSAREFEKLSAYVDGQLSARKMAVLEKKIRSNAVYQETLAELQETKRLLRSVPLKQVPHNFTLTSQMAGIRTARPAHLFPVLSISSAVAGVLVVVSLAIEMLGAPLLAGARMPMMAKEVPEAAIVFESEDMESVVTTETPMIIQWNESGAADQAAGKGGGADAGIAPSGEAVTDEMVEREEAAEAPQAEIMAEEAAPKAVEEEALEAAPDTFELQTQQDAPSALDVYPTQPAEAAPMPEDGLLTNEAQPRTLSEGEGPILGLPSVEEEGMMTVPETHEVQPVERVSRLSTLRIVQIILAIFAVVGGLLAVVLKRRRRS